MNHGRDEVGLGDLVLVHSGQEDRELELAEEVEGFAVADGKEVCPEGAEEVEYGEGDETSHGVGRRVGDGGVLGHERGMGEHGGFGKAGGAAGGVEGCWGGGCGCCVGDGEGSGGAMR